MGHVIKYQEGGSETNSLKKGNYWFGIGGRDYGPSDSTGFYAGFSPPENGYILYVGDGNGNVSNYVANTDEELVALVNMATGNSFENVLEALNHIASDDDLSVLNSNFEQIVTDRLVLDLNGKKLSSFTDNKPTVNLLEQPYAQSLDVRTDIYNRATKTNLGNGKFKFENDGTGVSTIRLLCNLSDLEDGETYACSVSYEQFDPGDGSSFSLDWCDLNSTSFPIGTYGAENRVSMSTFRETYTSIYRFFDITIPSNSSIVLFDAQVEKRAEATPYTDGTRSQNTTWYDISGNNNIFLSQNTVDFDPSGYLSTDGTDSYLEALPIPSVSNISGSDPFTFSTLFKLTQYANQRGTNSANVTSLLMKGRYNPSFGMSLYYDLPSEGVHTRARIYAGVRNLSLPSDSSGYGISDMFGYKEFELDKWYKTDLTIEFSGTSYIMKSYVNGEIDRQLTRTNSLYPIKFENDLSLECGSDAPLGGNGVFAPINLAKAQIYDKSLSQSEILQNYYGGPIITDGLVLAVDAGNLVSYESGSTTAYSMTGSYSGSLENNTEYSSLRGGNFVFDGTDDYISFPNFQTPLTNRSVELVTKINQSIDSSAQAHIYGNSDQPGDSINDKGIAIIYRYGNILCYLAGYDPNASPTSPRTSLTLVTSPSVDKYYHIVITHDNTTAKAYVNGELVDSQSCIGSREPSNNLTLGSYSPGYSTKYNGNISFVRVYNKTLTAEEVGQNYNAQSIRFK